ncbi:glutathione S-transferase-like [Symsagittifera roscoffensis]|uniref:glutathione S-transferase-like n=1 Tax=Symsagittifera roscoffensis TaxID=84072 RepID=UPI00307C08A6
MSIKLTYFPGKGAAELTRYILAYGGQDFEDNRITGDIWATLKPKTPLGSVPVVTLESGNEYSQSIAVARYFANKFGITGKTEEEKLHSDMIVDLMRIDIMPLFVKIYFQKDEETKKTMTEECKAKTLTWLNKLESGLVKGEASFLESGFSWADIALFCLVNDQFPLIQMDLGSDFPKLTAIVDKVKSDPKIAAWIEKRPVTPM